MRGLRFEILVLIAGGAALLGSLAFSIAMGPPPVSEIVAQFLLFGVLVAAVTHGLRGGLFAAIVASGCYLLMNVDALSASTITGDELLLLTARLLAFGLVGVAGGEVCSRLKYGMARLEDGSAIDEWSRVYNQRWALKTLVSAEERFRRYDEAFSVVLLRVSPSVLADFSAHRQRTMVRGVADHVRADVRMVDEVARLDDGRFVVILSHTPKAGGQIVAARLADGARRTLGARPEAVSVTCYSAPEEMPAIRALIEGIRESSDQAPSGAYRSSGISTRNPAPESTDSAP